MPTCPRCHRDYDTLTRSGLCRSCNIKNYLPDSETQARIDAVVAEAETKPEPVRARRQRRGKKGADQ